MCKKTLASIKKYYSIKYEKNKLLELIVFSLSFLFIGFLAAMLRDFANILFSNNFDKISIAIFVIVAFNLMLILWIIFKLLTNKHEGLIHYLLAAELILISLTKFIPIWIRTTIILIIIIALFPELVKKWYKLNLWLILTILISLGLLLMGFYFIQNTYGEEPLTIFLNTCDGGNRLNDVNLTCQSNAQEQLIEGYLTTCNLSSLKIFDNINGTITSILFNGTHYIDNFNQKIEFIPHHKTREIRFRILTTKNNITNCMDSNVREQLKFHSYEDAQDRKEKFNTYLLALFGIVIFSVPILILNLMNIWREGNK
jgi:hypothetical protein